MKHDPISPPPSSAESEGPRWTPRKMVEFLRALAATHSVGDAAKSVQMSRQSAYKLRSRSKGMAFDLAWDEAFTQSYCNLPYSALERALNGYEVPHYFKGELIGTSRRYDERLTVALLKLSSGTSGLAVGLPAGMAARGGRRFDALLDDIASHGEGAIDLAEEQACDVLSERDSADLSPASNAEKMAEFRRSRRKPPG
jgi:hypothetical protein